MRILGFAVVFFSLCITSIFHVHAQVADTDDFYVRIFMGVDNTAPTTPTLITADATTQTQVDLTWSVSTDDILLGGYVVFRDSSPIATTTLTSYSDTGLAASSTYTYYVQAFDTSYNYSSSSNALSVTTPDNPSVPEEEPRPGLGEGTVARVVADEVVVTPGYSTSSIYVKTPFPARFEIRWGRTASYELGYVATEAYRRDYTAYITDLEPGTLYEYEIIGYTPYGRQNVVKRGQFTTLSSFDLLPPANVSEFFGIANGSNVDLSWKLPVDTDVSFVRIVRNHIGFPLDPNDGSVVYQGTGENMTDWSILSRYSPVYYTAFVYDASGNVSSGAVVVVYARNIPSDSAVVKDYEIIPIGTDTKRASTTLDGTLRIPELFEIIIKQDGYAATYEHDDISLGANKPFLVSIPAEAVERHLKSIIVTLEDPTDNRKTFAFLLRLNKDKTAYEAVIAPVTVSGTAGMFVDIYDYQAYVVASYSHDINFTPAPDFVESITATADEFLNTYVWFFMFSILILLLLLLWWLIVSRRHEDKN